MNIDYAGFSEAKRSTFVTYSISNRELLQENVHIHHCLLFCTNWQMAHCKMNVFWTRQIKTMVITIEWCKYGYTCMIRSWWMVSLFRWYAWLACCSWWRTALEESFFCVLWITRSINYSIIEIGEMKAIRVAHCSNKAHHIDAYTFGYSFATSDCPCCQQASWWTQAIEA